MILRFQDSRELPPYVSGRPNCQSTFPLESAHPFHKLVLELRAEGRSAMLDWNIRASFDQTQIDRMRLAPMHASRALQFAFAEGEVGVATRECLARSVIECAAKGEFRPARLSAEALEAVNAVALLARARRAA